MATAAKIHQTVTVLRHAHLTLSRVARLSSLELDDKNGVKLSQILPNSINI